jgi:hypothetical protein
MVEDVWVGGEDPVREPVIAHILPDGLDRVELRRLGRQRQERDVVWDLQLGREVPPGLIEHQDGVMARCDGQADLLQMKGHGLRAAAGQDETGRLALGRTDGTEDVGRLGSLVARGRGTGSALGPAAGDLVLLPDPGLVAEPNFYRLAAGLGRGDLVQAGRERFLKASAAASLLA